MSNNFDLWRDYGLRQRSGGAIRDSSRRASQLRLTKNASLPYSGAAAEAHGKTVREWAREFLLKRSAASPTMTLCLRSW